MTAEGNTLEMATGIVDRHGYVLEDIASYLVGFQGRDEFIEEGFRSALIT